MCFFFHPSCCLIISWHVWVPAHPEKPQCQWRVKTISRLKRIFSSHYSSRLVNKGQNQPLSVIHSPLRTTKWMFCLFFPHSGCGWMQTGSLCTAGSWAAATDGFFNGTSCSVSNNPFKDTKYACMCALHMLRSLCAHVRLPNCCLLI